jgi:hypothetical protein
MSAANSENYWKLKNESYRKRADMVTVGTGGGGQLGSIGHLALNTTQVGADNAQDSGWR